MEKVRAIVLRAAGINCDVETEFALRLAGAEAQRVHINRIIESPDTLERYQILVVPGGFSYGDDVAAGKILANQIVHHLADAMRKFIADGKLVLGICNGFQVLVKAQILPGFADAAAREPTQQQVSITYNDSGKYEDRWVYLEPVSQRCVFVEPGRRIYLPVAHGEGKVVTRDKNILDRLEAEGHVAFRYVDRDGQWERFRLIPMGPSMRLRADGPRSRAGSHAAPRTVRASHAAPHWTRLAETNGAYGMTLFNNAVQFVKQNL